MERLVLMAPITEPLVEPFRLSTSVCNYIIIRDRSVVHKLDLAHYDAPAPPFPFQFRYTAPSNFATFFFLIC